MRAIPHKMIGALLREVVEATQAAGPSATARFKYTGSIYKRRGGDFEIGARAAGVIPATAPIDAEASAKVSRESEMTHVGDFEIVFSTD